MAIITADVKAELDKAKVVVFFVSGATTKWWNARRKKTPTQGRDIALLGGWYYVVGADELGPFRTPSAAARDAYYRYLLNQDPPLMSPADVRQAGREIAKAEAKEATKPHNIVVLPARMRRRA